MRALNKESIGKDCQKWKGGIKGDRGPFHEEVARMLGGVKITEKTKRHAEEMVKM